jgi:hypothetical protein
MESFFEKIQACVEIQLEYRRMASELSELDPRELEAIFQIEAREITRYCRGIVYARRERAECASRSASRPIGSSETTA